MRVRVPVRFGPYQYVRVTSSGESSTVSITHDQRDAGAAEVDVADGDSITEIALSSTSDPDLDPARGRLWPPPEA